MNTLSEARAEANAAKRLVCLLAFEIAKLNKELMGGRHKTRSAWTPDQRTMASQRVALPPLTDTETLPPSRCQREAVRQHKPRNGLASPSAGDER